MKKSRIALFSVCALTLLSLPVTLVSVGFGMPSVFSETYYGELSTMYSKLKSQTYNKIVVLGNSAVAFGVRSDLLQSELPDYVVTNFGLYGAVGTKAMIDLSRNEIKSGDIVVLTIEPYQQTSSLYFSGKEMWRAADSDMSMLSSIPYDHGSYMVGSFPSYVAEKIKYSSADEKPMNTGAYSASAFLGHNGEKLDYVTYDRPYNVMSGGYDSANLPVIGKEVFGAGFIDYLNEYASFVKGKGASIFYGFCPVNALSVGENAEQKADELYDFLATNLKFPILGHPDKYFLDYRFFYDNNVHMNSAGMYHFTDLLAEDLKFALGKKPVTNIELPEAPEIPPESVTEEDNSDLDKFDFEIVEGATEKYARITKLNEEGKKAAELTIPSTYEGYPVREFDPTTFQNDTVISRITLPSNIHVIYNESFAGAIRLSALYFRHDSILGINVGTDFLEGADNCYIYLKSTVQIADCAGGWERYQSRIRIY